MRRNAVPRRAALAAGLALAIAAAARADWETGVAALERGDLSEAARQLRRAARDGHVLAQYTLGTLYVHGKGVDADPEQAEKWLRKAARAGLPPAQSALGALYASGQSAERGDGEALKWYRKAAEYGDAAGQAGLGVMLHLGRGARRNAAEAYFWLRLAEAQGNELAARHASAIAEELGDAKRAEVERRVGAFKPKKLRYRAGGGPTVPAPIGAAPY